MLIRDFNFLQSNENVHLSVILMADSFFYAVIDQHHRLLAHASFLSVRYSDPESTRAILEDALLQAEYTTVHVHVFNPWQIQLAIEDEDMLRMLPSMHYKEISKHTLPGTSGVAYFAMTNHQSALIESLFDGKNMLITNVVQLFANYFKDKPGKIMHLHVEEDTIHAYMQQDMSFLFYNQLIISGAQDVLYFVIALCEENNWNPADMYITISGWIVSDNSIINLLNTYFPKCKMVEMDAFSLPIELDPSIRPSCYFAHYAGKSCA